ncbi:class I SAM-dependent methyltransferase [Thermosynechococcus sp. PP45]|uniref:class I SAM-dependent methyltransferase n=1 Tax=unclassified Thermosynechococcus TaxID=2622553 RepID=UPI00267373E4|nr:MULTISPECIES: class I SAM-dependent methyltransferase [unclassified Thermosynechococcus]WKT81359.1 class I SAM-dependent methyltransferase [Thermosynechococcus sp. PP45]WNC24971.1 class I SAM-dependent methyltransferase [Thermosynechococcus sp. PP551]WNC27548.1 class I SAM-dependent methyltransferase [Thermosynechococcus sp. PP555]
MTSLNQQDTIFVNQEADAWYERNAASATEPAPANDRILRALSHLTLPAQGILIDVGGSSGRVAEGFRRQYPQWHCRVVEPSGKAIAAGKKAFPHLEFTQGSITQAQGLPWQEATIVVISSVFHWVDRSLLSRAVANVDLALKDGGYLVISDFDSPFLRANAYKHRSGLYTYKQDYAEIFRQLGIYHLIYRFSETLVDHSGSDLDDPYDRQWVTSILRKDLQDRYFHKSE